MSAATSPGPWDLRTGHKWKIESSDPNHAGDRNTEVIVDAKGNVVAYVSGFNDEGGNGTLLKAAPALRDALKETLRVLEDDSDATPRATAREMARAALKQAGAL